MRSFFLHHTFLVSVAGLMIGGAGFMVRQLLHADPLDGLVTTTISRGTVEQIVSVSGITKAAGTAELAFPTQGIVSKVYVREGDQVEAGDVLATLGAESLVAERSSALADRRVAEANLQELLAGDTLADRTVRSTTIQNTTADIERIKTTQALLVANARRTLLSSGLAARADNPNNDARAPQISGTYTCQSEGSYQLNIYPSNSVSGYSVRYTGLETGSEPLSIEQPTPLGDCGLLIQLTAGEPYGNSFWTITIPNPDASTHTTYKNALDTAIATAATTIAAAEDSLVLTQQQSTAKDAAPRSEAVERAQAQVSKSLSQVAKIDAALSDRVIRAPFNGTVSLVDILPGETAGSKPVFTVLATDKLELTARIPEIDITRVVLDQPARVRFDANANETHSGHISYIAPLPTEIDGVAYFEVKIVLTTIPVWLRGGLNADIDIITDSRENVLRVPKRYVTTTSDQSVIRILSDAKIATTTITKVFEGNDGFVAIDGLTEGTIVVTP